MAEIPDNPQRVYRSEGWEGWAKFLGLTDPQAVANAKLRDFRDEVEALVLRHLTDDERGELAHDILDVLPMHIRRKWVEKINTALEDANE